MDNYAKKHVRILDHILYLVYGPAVNCRDIKGEI